MKTLNLVLSIPQHQMDIENGGVLRRVLSEERERENDRSLVSHQVSCVCSTGSTVPVLYRYYRSRSDRPRSQVIQ